MSDPEWVGHVLSAIAALRTFRSLAISSRSASIVRAVLNVKVDVDADEEVTNLMAVFTRVPACPEIVMRMYMARSFSCCLSLFLLLVAVAYVHFPRARFLLDSLILGV